MHPETLCVCIHIEWDSFSFPEHRARSEAQYFLLKQMTDIPSKGVGGWRKEEILKKKACLVKYFMVPKVGVVRRFSLVEMELENRRVSSTVVGQAPPPASVTDIAEQLQGSDAAVGVHACLGYKRLLRTSCTHSYHVECQSHFVYIFKT